jgi:hypothetical protein
MVLSLVELPTARHTVDDLQDTPLRELASRELAVAPFGSGVAGIVQFFPFHDSASVNSTATSGLKYCPVAVQAVEVAQDTAARELVGAPFALVA